MFEQNARFIRLFSAARDRACRAAKLVIVEAFRIAITPVLTVKNATAAVAFYKRAFGAEEIHRNSDPDGKVVAEMAVGGARFRVADEMPEAANLSPETLKGTTVRINLLVADPNALSERAIASGAIEVAPVADQPYGLRQGRLADPFGHHWLIGRPLADSSGDWARSSGHQPVEKGAANESDGSWLGGNPNGDAPWSWPPYMRRCSDCRWSMRRRGSGCSSSRRPPCRGVSPTYPGKDHFDTGPDVGFAVDDLTSAVQELREAGIELLGPPGPTWQHFRGPDGNVYELNSD
jgi:PhnB protein